MTYQPGEPSYVPPQDPWADTYGGASAPTEPLPAPEPSRGPGQFAPGVASPVDWSRSTIAPDDPVTSTSSGGSRAGLYVLVFLLTAVLAGAGGISSWWLTSRYAGQIAGRQPTGTSTTTSADPSPTPTPTQAEFIYDPRRVKEGDCLTNRGTAGQVEMWVVPCDQPDTYLVLKVVPGDDIPADKRDTFHLPDTARALHAELCADEPMSDAWFGFNAPNDANDHFYCLTRNNPAV